MKIPGTFFKTATILVLCLFIISCGELYDPKQMQKLTKTKTLTLMEDYSYTYTQGLGAKSQITLHKGTYTATEDGFGGLWFLGNENSLETICTDRGGAIGIPKESLNVSRYSQCGIFVPHDSAKMPKIYVIYGQISAQNKDNNPENQNININETTVNVVNNTAGATTTTAGAGSGLAAGIVALSVESAKNDIGKYMFYLGQDEGSNIRKLFTIN